MNTLSIKRAARTQSKIKIALTGPTGSGKTFSAIRLAFGLTKGKVGVIDTENGSACLYADIFPEFDVIELSPPYTIEKYESALAMFLKEGHEVVIMDSISHAWSGEGGILQQKEKLDSRPGSNSFSNWASLTPAQERFVSTILHAPIHLICTMRSKMAYELVDDKGKKKPVKLGLAPVQRDGIEYEFSVVFEIDQNHQCVASKNRTPLFKDQIFQITEETGMSIANWIATGKSCEIINRDLNRSIVGKLMAIKDETDRNKILEDLGTILARSRPITGNEILGLGEQGAKACLEFINKIGVKK